jgi:hypothetical protein
MNRNKSGQETKWSLYKIKLYPNYPCFLYFWVDEDGIIRYQRPIQPTGFMPVICANMIGANIKECKGLKKVSNHRMTDEELKQGWLVL